MFREPVSCGDPAANLLADSNAAGLALAGGGGGGGGGNGSSVFSSAWTAADGTRWCDDFGPYGAGTQFYIAHHRANWRPGAIADGGCATFTIDSALLDRYEVGTFFLDGCGPRKVRCRIRPEAH